MATAMVCIPLIGLCRDLSTLNLVLNYYMKGEMIPGNCLISLSTLLLSRLHLPSSWFHLIYSFSCREILYNYKRFRIG